MNYPTYDAPSDKMVCPRAHLDDATLAELMTAISKNALVDSPFGPMKVFREYIPRKNAIEYTVFFNSESGEKLRLDSEFTEEEIHAMVDPEGEIRDRIFTQITEGLAKRANETSL